MLSNILDNVLSALFMFLFAAILHFIDDCLRRAIIGERCISFILTKGARDPHETLPGGTSVNCFSSRAIHMPELQNMSAL